MHVAFVAPPLRGHLDPLRAVAQALVQRGHRATLVARIDAQPMWQGAGLSFMPVGEDLQPAGTLPATVAALTRRGPFALTAMMRELARDSAVLCERAPAALRAMGADVLVADQAEAAGGLLAAHLGLPLVTAASALPLDRDPDVPPPWRAWPADATPAGRRRNAVRWGIADALRAPLDRAMAVQAGRLGLPPGPAEAWWSRSATLAQLVPELDFPRARPPPGFACVGPWRTTSPPTLEPSLAACVDAAPGPLVFCSFGTLQRGRAALFATVAGACADLGLTAVIAHAGGLAAQSAAALPGAPIVRDVVAQRALLPHCVAAVVHGGLNTVLDALAAGVPLVVMPLGFEQPGVAARLQAQAAAAVVDPVRWRLRGRLRDAIAAVLDGPHAGQAARLARAIAAGGGAQAVVTCIERSAHGPPHRPRHDAGR